MGKKYLKKIKINKYSIILIINNNIILLLLLLLILILMYTIRNIKKDNLNFIYIL